MATQLSAITMIGTTGQGYNDGLRFLQFYFGLPLAMVILSVTLVPFLHRAKVYTAYEYLERRFDAKTRTLTSSPVPALARHVVRHDHLRARRGALGHLRLEPHADGAAHRRADGDLHDARRRAGGHLGRRQADVLIVFGLVAVAIALVVSLPGDVSIGDALRVAGATGRLQAFDFRFDLTSSTRSGRALIGGLFLLLSYFGTDQSQVQRYLTARSVDEARASLLMSAYWKIPLQALVLLIGVLVFVFYLFRRRRCCSTRSHEARLRGRPAAGRVRGARAALRRRRIEARRDAADARWPTADDPARHEAAAEATFVAARRRAAGRAERGARPGAGRRPATGHTHDVNYVFPTFVMTQLPIGLVGLVIAAIFAAAMSSDRRGAQRAGDATVIDFYRRLLRPEAPDAHYLTVSRSPPAFWGLFACVVALFAAELGSLIEVVNRFGSFFYGSILGVFVLAMSTRRASGRARSSV